MDRTILSAERPCSTGNASLNIQGGLTINGQGGLSVSSKSTLDVSGNLLGNTTNAAGFNPSEP